MQNSWFLFSKPKPLVGTGEFTEAVEEKKRTGVLLVGVLGLPRAESGNGE